MKIFIIISLLGASAFANSDYSILPAKLKCTSKAKSQEAQSFEITNMDTEEPESSLNDASLMDVEYIKGSYYSVGFSNQCDNSYSLTFKVSDLVKLKSKKFHFVTGKLDYFDTWLSEANGDDGDTENEKLSVFCTR